MIKCFYEEFFDYHLEEDRVLCGKDCQEMMELLNPRQDQAKEAPTGHKILQSFSSTCFFSTFSIRKLLQQRNSAELFVSRGV